MTRRPAPPQWLAAPSRFAGLPPVRARAILAALAVLLVWALAAPYAPPVAAGPASGSGDIALYDGVIAGMRGGGTYYPLAAAGLRAGDYPLHPFVAVRPPLHAVVQAALPPVVVVALLHLLALAVGLALWCRLAARLRAGPPRVALAVLLAGGLAAFVQPGLAALHEIWAGLLVALALALHAPSRWPVSAALLLTAMLVRETAALATLVLLTAAWRDGARAEAAGLAACLAVFAAALAAHAFGVAQVATAADPVSPGWHGLLGLAFAGWALAQATALALLPSGPGAAIALLALFGLAGAPGEGRLAATLAGYAVALAVFARADTFYWGLMAAPALIAGLAVLPDALRDVARAAVDRRRVRVHRITQ